MSMTMNELVQQNAELQTKNTLLATAYKNLTSEVNGLKGTIENLDFQLKKLLLARFGKKSEKLTEIDKQQLDMFIDLVPEMQPEEAPNTSEEITIPLHKRKKPGRKPLPADLPRIRESHDLSEDQKICPCGYQLRKIK